MTKFDIQSWADIITPNKFAPLSDDWTHPRVANKAAKKAAKTLKLAEEKKLVEKTEDQNVLRRGQRW